MRRFFSAWILLLVGAFLGVVFSQTPIKNPSALAFTCPDHAQDTQHEVAIVRESDGVTVQTISAGDPPLTNGEVIVPLNVQPTAFGRYRFKARVGGLDTTGALVWSEWSDVTEIWERAPGKLTDLRAIAK